MLRCFAIALCLSYNLKLNAHDTWLLPASYSISNGKPCQLDLTSGMKFPVLDHAIKAERVSHAQYRLVDATSNLPKPTSEDQSLRYQPSFTSAGLATVWVSLLPRKLTLDEDKVIEYLEEIGASEEIRKQWEKTNPRRWREEYTKHAKTFVMVGEKTDESWKKPTGQVLELLPQSDPTTFTTSKQYTFVVLKDGKPLPNLVISAVAQNEMNDIKIKTDKEGKVTFRFNKAGQWLLRGTELTASTKPDLDWESQFVTLTFNIHK